MKLKRLLLVLFLAGCGLGLVVFRPNLHATTPTSITQTQQLADRLPAEKLAPLTQQNCVKGMAANTYPCQSVDLLAFLPLSGIGGGEGNDVWGWTDPTTNKEYAIMGTTEGTAFVDISTPTAPVYLGLLPHQGTDSFWDGWRDVKVHNNYAFVVSENRGHGMQIFDLTQLRSVSNPPQTFANSAHYDGIGGSHNVFINEDSGYAYVIGAVAGGTETESNCNGGLHIVDVNNPLSPSFTGCFDADGYTHDVQCVIYAGPDTTYTGKEICFASNEDTLTIIDATSKISPTQISRTGYSGARYAHQGWLTDDQAYFLLNDELDEDSSGRNAVTYLWNVSDLDAPSMFADYEAAIPVRDHNLYIKGNFVYQANYQGGLSILSLSNLAAGTLTEVANFDIYPSSNSMGYNGAWSVYPFFPSGAIVVSGIEQGLYILRHNLVPTVSLLNASPEVTICDGGTQSVIVQINPFTDLASLSLSTVDLPSHVSSEFTTPTVGGNGNYTSVLSLDASAATIGEYPFTLQATDGTLSDDLAMTVKTHVTPVAVPMTPTLGVSVAPNPILNWTASASTQYTIEVATDSTFNSIVISDVVSGDSYTVTMALTPETTYHWRVRGSNACGTVTSATATFMLDPVYNVYLPSILKP